MLALPLAVADAPAPAWKSPCQLASAPPPPAAAENPAKIETLSDPDIPFTNPLMAPAIGGEVIATAPRAMPATPAAFSASCRAWPPFFCHIVKWLAAFLRFFVAVDSS